MRHTKNLREPKPQLLWTRIEQLNPPPLDALTHLYMQAYRDMPQYGEQNYSSAREYLKWLMRHHTFFEVVLHERAPIGFVVADAQWKSRFGEGGHIHEWVVHPDWRRQGIGKQLFFHALKHLQEAGHRYVVLWAGERNTIASAFYQRVGFRPEGKYRFWVRWVLDLQQQNFPREFPGPSPEETHSRYPG